ncbi:MAG: ribonuclease P protein component, partial [Deltaproteobacteria bacterium]|nr:ribonuclease P protein component [Deltaproteobacteria bacterium]
MGIATGSFKRLDRLLRHQEFRYVTRYGQVARLESFVVLAVVREANDEKDRVRLGVTASRRVGNATTRNRVKRRIR